MVLELEPFMPYPDTSTPISAPRLNALQTLVVGAAQAAEDAAASAAAAVAMIGTPSDVVVGGLIDNAGSATTTALAAKYVTKTGLDAASATLVTSPSSTRTAMDSRYRPVPAPGTYAARPAPTAVQPGSFYVATDVQEMYVSTGTAWVVVGSGNELGRAQVTALQSFTSTTPVDIPGMTVSWTAGERPAEVRFSGDFAANVAGALTQLRVFMDGATGTSYIGTPLLTQGAASGWQTASFAYKIPTMTPGTAHSVRLAINVQSGSSVNMGGSATSPGSLRVVSL